MLKSAKHGTMLKDWEYDPSAERVAVIGVPEEARA